VAMPLRSRGERSLVEMVAQGLLYAGHIEARLSRRHEISRAEVEVFGDLLGRLLRYDPEERILARAVLDYGWFKM
jgi:hypothetical protein